MGFKYYDADIICPLYKRVTRTNKGQVILLSCHNDAVNLGFTADPSLRFRNSRDLKDYIEIFCKDCYKTCPLYEKFAKEG